MSSFAATYAGNKSSSRLRISGEGRSGGRTHVAELGRWSGLELYGCCGGATAGTLGPFGTVGGSEAAGVEVEVALAAEAEVLFPGVEVTGVVAFAAVDPKAGTWGGGEVDCNVRRLTANGSGERLRYDDCRSNLSSW